jgi:hypothetical protein
MEFNLNNLSILTVKELREDNTKELVADLLMCLKDKVSINSWIEDTQDEPTAYPYTTDELKTFLLTIKLEY